MASEMVTVARKSEMDTPVDDDALASAGFADWIRRPDATGRMGWERPDLPERKRWWAHSTFEELPEPPPACDECGGLEFCWNSSSERCCVRCHPPAISDTLRQQVSRLRGQPGIPDFEVPMSVPGIDLCPWCGRLKWWRSIQGVIVCGNCHPPAVPSLAVEWLSGGDARPKEKSI